MERPDRAPAEGEGRAAQRGVTASPAVARRRPAMNHRAYVLSEGRWAPWFSYNFRLPMPYWRLFYHAVWTTRNREALIEPAREQDLHRYLWEKARTLGGLPHAVGGIEDHIHLALSIPPRLAVSIAIGQLKGASSHFVTHVVAPDSGFAWQGEYGVLSFSERALPKVVAYVRRQRQHHAAGTLQPRLESAL